LKRRFDRIRVMPSSWAAAGALILALSAGCAQILGVDELPVAPDGGGLTDAGRLESGAGEVGMSDAAAPEVVAEDGTVDVGSDQSLVDSGFDCGNPAEILFSGWSVSDSAIKFEFTPGPAYRLTREVTHADDEGDDFFFLPQCTSTYEDGVMTGMPLNSNWQYTYVLQPLSPDGGDDPSFGPLTLIIQTWDKPNDPQGPSGDGSTFEWAADGG
jgi:hypothetical protein